MPSWGTIFCVFLIAFTSIQEVDNRKADQKRIHDLEVRVEKLEKKSPSSITIQNQSTPSPNGFLGQPVHLPNDPEWGLRPGERLYNH